MNAFYFERPASPPHEACLDFSRGIGGVSSAVCIRNMHSLGSKWIFTSRDKDDKKIQPNPSLGLVLPCRPAAVRAGRYTVCSFQLSTMHVRVEVFAIITGGQAELELYSAHIPPLPPNISYNSTFACVKFVFFEGSDEQEYSTRGNFR